MSKERIVLIIAALMLIGAFFLPFINFTASFLGLTTETVGVSGLQITAQAVGLNQTMDTGSASKVVDLIKEMASKADSFGDYARLAGFGMVLAGPAVFLLFGLNYLVLGLRNRSYNRGIFLALFYSGIAWLTFLLLQDWDLGLSLNDIDFSKASFFKMARGGYWLDMAGMLLAAFSYFFAQDARS